MRGRNVWAIAIAMLLTACSGTSDDSSTEPVTPPGDATSDVTTDDATSGDVVTDTVDPASVTIDVTDLVAPPVSDGLVQLQQYQAEEVAAGLRELGVDVPADAFVPTTEVFDEARRLLDDLTAGANAELGIDPSSDSSSDATVSGFAGPKRSLPGSTTPSAIEAVTGFSIGMAGLWLDTASGGAEEFETGEKDASGSFGGTGINLSLQMGRSGNRITATGGFGVTQTITVDGQTITMAVTAKAKLSVDICPDPSGKVGVEFHIEAKTSGNVPGAGSVSSDLTIDGTAVAQVDDSAEIADVSMQFTSGQGARTLGAGTEANPKASYFEMDWELGMNGNDIANLEVHKVEATRVSSQPPEGVSDSFRLTMLGAAFAVQVALDKARDHWQNGGCVKLQIDAPERVSPKSESPVTAMVHHEQEKQDLELPVTAEVTAGGKSIDPDSATGKPAKFTYTAPDKGGDTATVSFETRSRRGADQKSVNIEIGQTLVASTVSGRITVSGIVTDITAPFSLSGEFEGGSATLTFIPADDSGGAMTYSGGGSGVTVSGDGNYTIVDDGDGSYTLSYSSHGCASGGGTCADQQAVISLDPTE